MEECDLEIDPKKREFMDFVVTKSATNVYTYPQIIQSYQDL
jgi:hypothetical protein